MTLNFFRKCFFHCFFIVILSSCTAGNNTTGKTDLSKDKALVAGEEQTDGVPSAEGSAEDDPAASEQEENLPPLEAPAEEDPKDSAVPAEGSSEDDPAISDQEESLSLPDVTASEEPAAEEEPASQSFIREEDVVNAGLLKEKDFDIDKIYISVFLNNIKDLDLKAITASDMREIITMFSKFPSATISVLDPESGKREPTAYLHLNLVPPGWGPHSYQEIEEGEDPPHITDMQKMIDEMKEAGIKRVAVNFPLQGHNEPFPFFMLGQFIKENQVDLYIVGACEAYCAKYLIPAAKTVYIGSYGYIHFHGSFGGAFEQVLSVLPVQRAADENRLRDELSRLGEEGKIEALDTGLEAFLGEVPSGSVLINNFKIWDPKRVQEFQAQLQAFYPRVNKTDMKTFTIKERRLFLEQLSEDLLDSLVLFLKQTTDENIIKQTQYADILSALAISELFYYQSIEVTPAVVDKNNHYTYAGLLNLATKLLQDNNYRQAFSVLKPYYNVPEEEKLYHVIVPSADLLRRVGFDVRGENNIDMMGIDKNSKKDYLYLDSKRIENCGFFGKGVSYKTLDCLFE